MSAKKLKGVELGDAIIRELNAYAEGLCTELDNAARRSAKELREELIDTSPEDTGKYGAAWRVKEIPGKELNQPSKYVVHNATRYRLTHLLEFGHAIHDGTARAPAYPHIEPAREKIEASYFQDLEEAVKKVGK